jgi:ABC-2 type transport system ATP-binding protein
MCFFTLTTEGRDLFILDEPTAGVDPESRLLIWNRISNLTRAGKAVVVSSHLLDELNERTSRLLFINNGDLKMFSNFADFKTSHGASSADEAFVKATIQTQTR